LIRLSSLLDETRKILARDIDPAFLETASINLAWRYDSLYEHLDQTKLPVEAKLEQFAMLRGSCAVEALLFACQRHRVPFNFRTLGCNGQQKLLVKIGRIVLIQEPMLELTDYPRATDYKRELADTHGVIRQLELNLGDQPGRILDWSGGVLAVMLHAPAGPRFTREHRALGGLLLAVPDASYSYWTMRLDLHRIAMHGFGIAEEIAVPVPPTAPPGAQPDNVVVKLKKKSRTTGAA
jgi:hypothetical protein